MGLAAGCLAIPQIRDTGRVSHATINTAGNVAVGSGWIATLASLCALITPSQVQAWVPVLQALAVGVITIYLTAWKAYETVARESLTHRISSLEDDLAQSKADRARLMARLGMSDAATPPPGHP